MAFKGHLFFLLIRKKMEENKKETEKETKDLKRQLQDAKKRAEKMATVAKKVILHLIKDQFRFEKFCTSYDCLLIVFITFIAKES